MTTKVSRGGSILAGVTGANQWRGIATISSGTTVATVAANASRSGSVILTNLYNFATLQSSGQGITTGVQSVGAGQFLIVCAGSVAPATGINVAWAIIR